MAQYQNRLVRCLLLPLALAGAAFAASLAIGRYPIPWGRLLADPIACRVFFNLRLARTCMALTAGFALGAAGSVYLAVFQNPLASPDIIGVSSGASAGAAVSILLLGGGAGATALAALAGGLAAVCAALVLDSLARRTGAMTLVLSGIVVSSMAQAGLMLMKLTADPEKELAAIEFWTMGSLADVTMVKFRGVLPWTALGLTGLCLLHRQILLLGLAEHDACMLGVPVRHMRRIVLVLATLAVSSVVSVTGLISFVGLLAPHMARLLTRSSRFSTALLSGWIGGCLLLVSDILARSIAPGEVPISIITSLLGAPFLFFLVCRRGRPYG